MTSPHKIERILSDKKVLNLYKENKLYMNKKWYQSKTLKLGAIQIIVGVLAAVEGQIIAGTAFTVFGFLILVLRVITNSKLVK